MKILLPILAFSIVIVSCGIKHAKQPEYRDVRNIRLINLGPLQSTAGVDLVLFNPNNFGAQVEVVKGDIYVDSIFLGQFELNEKVSVKKRAEFTLPALVKIDMISMIKNQRELLKKKEAMIRIDGSATIRKAGISKDIPIKYESLQDLEKYKTLISH